MAKRKRSRKQKEEAAPRRQAADEVDAVVFDPERAGTPLQVARGFGALILLVGLVMFVLGMGVLFGRITQGWGFPMSAVPNWGKPWGLVLAVAGLAYVIFPVLLMVRPRVGSLAMMIVSGLSILIGTPLITTATEIFYNLFQEPEAMHRPDWVDSVWAYFMIVNVVILIGLYKSHTPAKEQAKPATTG